MYLTPQDWARRFYAQAVLTRVAITSSAENLASFAAWAKAEAA